MFKPILYLFLRVVAYTIMMLVILEVIKIDSRSADFNESSITEILQQAFVFIGFAFSFWLSFKRKQYQWFLISMAALLLVIFIREYNNFFENYVGEGVWTALIVTVFIAYAIVIRKHIKALVYQIGMVANHFSFGVFLVGFLIVMIFSRIYGVDEIWVNLLGDNFIRPIKRISEEGTELLGYGMMLLGVLEMYNLGKQQPQT